MRTRILGFIVLCLAGGIIFWAGRSSAPTQPAAMPARGTEKGRDVPVSPPPVQSTPEGVVPKERISAENGERAIVGGTPAPLRAASESEPEISEPLKQALALLVSSQTGLPQKRAIWAQLKQAGQLDTAIAELESRAKNDPTDAEYPLDLGEAYLFKIDAGGDPREQAILGISADQKFDAALKLDPANWEAGFYKAAALARYPDGMNKGPEVIQRFNDLMQSQEAMPQRVEFATTYVLLGEQYVKSGKPDEARQVWLRGAALFPSSPSIQAKLAPSP